MTNRMRVLYATDFLASSAVALEMLKTLSEKYYLDITFMHIITSFWRDWFTSGVYEQEAKSRLKKWYEKVQPDRFKFDESKLLVFKGNAADYITMQASLMEADLIVVGGGGEPSSHRDVITGTTAEAIVQYSRQSVLLVKRSEITKIICGIDGSANSRKALNQAVDLAWRYSASLKVVHVIPGAEFNPLGLKKDDIIKNEDTFKEQRIQEIKEFLTDIDFQGVRAEILHERGVASRVLLSMAENENADMIVIGATGRGKLTSLIIGTTATHTMRRAPCSLYIVK